MSLSKGQNPNHPKLGSSIQVEPIRTKTAIENIKKILRDNPRNLCLFTLGMNTAYRAHAAFAEDPEPEGTLLHWVCRDNLDYLDLTKDRLELTPA